MIEKIGLCQNLMWMELRDNGVNDGVTDVQQ
jgi:hypothetical protein